MTEADEQPLAKAARSSEKPMALAQENGMFGRVCSGAQMLSAPPGICRSCKYKAYEKGLRVRNAPANIK